MAKKVKKRDTTLKEEEERTTRFDHWVSHHPAGEKMAQGNGTVVVRQTYNDNDNDNNNKLEGNHVAPIRTGNR